MTSTAATTTNNANHAAAAKASRAGRRSQWYEPLLDRGRIPEFALRAGIRRELARLIARHSSGGAEAIQARFRTFVGDLRQAPIAIEVDAANEQHYELPPAFFTKVLGRHLKYSGCYWPDGVRTLDDAERAMLDLYVERAGIADGQRILDLGCGWGSFGLHIAERFPLARLLCVSNSTLQREFIRGEAQRRGLTNLEVETCDMNTYRPGRAVFDRVVSVEMFEHMKNYERLLANIAEWLVPGGRLFVHIFTHRELAYHFEAEEGWMTKYFFTGGTMPSDHLLHHFQRDLRLIDHWRLSGTHYEKTAEAWVENFDRHAAEIRSILASTYPPGEVEAWFHRWRVFFVSCAVVWGFRGGNEWLVSHYLFERPLDRLR